MPMVDSFDVVVVGGGIVGAACFEALAAIGQRVLLLEERRLAQGATGWSGAVVRVAHSDAQCTAQAAFGCRAYRALAERHPGAVVFRDTGYLHFADDPGLDLLDSNCTSAAAGHQILSSAQLRALFPDLDIRAQQAIFEPESGFMDPVATTKALAALGCAQGGQIRECARAFELLVEAGQITGIETETGRISCGTIVLATGEGTGDFLRRAGVADYFVRAQLIQVTLFQAARPLPAAPAFIDDETDTNGVFCPGTGGLYVGLPTGIARDSGDRLGRMDPAHAEATRLAGATRFGWLKDAQPCGGLCHTDAYSDTPGGLIGPCPGGPDGLFLATGFSGGGYKMAPYAAASITAAITGQRLAAE